MKTIAEIEKMKADELTAFVAEKRAEVQKHRFGMGGRDVNASRAAKTEIARALTVQTKRLKETTN